MLSVIALFLVLKQLRKDGLAASANAVGEAYNSIVAAVNELEGKEDGERSAALTEVFNQLEMACALKRDGQFIGHSGELASKLLVDLTGLIMVDEENRRHFFAASQNTKTFQNIKAIMAEENISTSSQAKQLMKERHEVAEIVFKDYKEMQRATFDVASQWGRWLLASLLLIHGGALFGLFTFLSDLAEKPEALSKYQWTVYWFVAGLILTLLSGFMAWINWSMHSDNYDAWANKQMLWDPEQWTGQSRHTWGLDVTNWGAIIFGLFSGLCIAGGAYSTLNGNWVELVKTALV